MPQPGQTRDGPRRTTAVLAAAVAAVVAAVVLWGGYSHRWSWTGINGHTATLWDWLHVLLLPGAFALLPVWLAERGRLSPRHRHIAGIAFSAFGILVLAGYTIPWAWTGFVGNRLWDWLELLALPLAVALSPLGDQIRSAWSPRHTAIALCGLVAFVIVVIGGYVGDWRWTGFRGNTLWNWFELLLVPLLLPFVVVPKLKPMAEAALRPLPGATDATEATEATDATEATAATGARDASNAQRASDAAGAADTEDRGAASGEAASGEAASGEAARSSEVSGGLGSGSGGTVDSTRRPGR